MGPKEEGGIHVRVPISRGPGLELRRHFLSSSSIGQFSVLATTTASFMYSVNSLVFHRCKLRADWPRAQTRARIVRWLVENGYISNCPIRFIPDVRFLLWKVSLVFVGKRFLPDFYVFISWELNVFSYRVKKSSSQNSFAGFRGQKFPFWFRCVNFMRI